jgi:hypothetical protein
VLLLAAQIVLRGDCAGDRLLWSLPSISDRILLLKCRRLGTPKAGLRQVLRGVDRDQRGSLRYNGLSRGQRSYCKIFSVAVCGVCGAACDQRHVAVPHEVLQD